MYRGKAGMRRSIFRLTSGWTSRITQNIWQLKFAACKSMCVVLTRSNPFARQAGGLSEKTPLC